MHIQAEVYPPISIVHKINLIVRYCIIKKEREENYRVDNIHTCVCTAGIETWFGKLYKVHD